MLNKIIRTGVSTARNYHSFYSFSFMHIGTLRNSTRARNSLFLFDEQNNRHKHFYLVQWPDNSFSCRLLQEDEIFDDEHINTISRYALMQHNSMNVKEKTFQPLEFNISSQALKELSQKLNLTDAEDANVKASTLNIQSNNITLIDRTPSNFNASNIDKPIVVQPAAQVQKQTKKAKKRNNNKDTAAAAVAGIITVKKEGEPQEE